MNNLLVGGAFLGVLTAMWSYIQTFAWKLTNVFIQSVNLGMTGDCTAVGVVNYLLRECKLSPIYDVEIESHYMRYRECGKYGSVAMQKMGDQTLFFWFGWRPIIYSVAKVGDANKGVNHARLIFPRWLFNYKKLIGRATADYNKIWWSDLSVDEKSSTRYRIVEIPSANHQSTEISAAIRLNPDERRLVPIGLDYDAVGPDVTHDSKISRMFLPDDVLEEFENCRRWVKSAAFYKRMGIPHKRGWLLYGPPGCGKSALADALAHDLNMPIYVYRLADLTNAEFVKTWKKMRSDTPCVALLEDFDNVFHGRVNIATDHRFDGLFARMKTTDDGPSVKTDDDGGMGANSPYGSRLSFDVLLNCIDGVDRSEGVFTIITTNDLSKIDPALGIPTEDGGFVSTRPGRIDRAIHLTHLTSDVKVRMAEHLLCDYPKLLDAVLEEVREADRRETPAQFQERLGQMALKEYWAVSS